MTSNVYDIIYDDFCGVDFSEESSLISPHCFAYLENMYRDYGGAANAGVETIPGFRSLYGFGGPIRGLFKSPEQEEALLVHAGEALYRLPIAERDSPGELSPIRKRSGVVGRMAPERSQGLLFNGKLLLLDGERYRFYEDGCLSDAINDAYCPTLFKDGEPYEQINLLTTEFKEEYRLFELGGLSFGTDSLTYRIRYDGLCYVSGITGEDAVVVIPPIANVGGREYPVAGISADAFRGNRSIKELIVSEGIVDLDYRALAYMEALETVVLPSTVTLIKNQCFAFNPQLRHIYLPSSLLIIRDYAFEGSPATHTYYAGSFSSFFEIEGAANLYNITNPGEHLLHPEVIYKKQRLFIPFSVKTETITMALLDDEYISTEEGALYYRPQYTEERGRRLVCGILLYAEEEALLYGKTLSLHGLLYDDFAEQIRLTHPSYSGMGVDAINGCRIACLFSDRVFLSGNPALPGMVFYNQREEGGGSHPFYFGALNYFTDGNGILPINAMTATASSLFVFTEGGMGEASLFCHTEKETGDNLVSTVYPLTEGGFRIGCRGAACTFFDDTVFLSERGLDAVEAAAINGERSLRHCSSAVDRKLTAEPLSEAVLFRFGSYLGIGIGGRVYLADGRRLTLRNGQREYEWYYLSDIGIYRGQTDRYHTVTSIPAALEGKTISLSGAPLTIITDESEKPIDGETVYSKESDDGSVTFYYVLREGRALLVDCDGEKIGGEFFPATVFCEAAGLLFFGTNDGSLAVFNTDKREEDGHIPRRYYSFNGRAYFSCCATRSENCGRPNLQKSTLRGFGAVKLKAMTGGRISVRVRTDREDWQDCDTLYGGRLDFSATDFGGAELSPLPETILPLREKKKRWAEKQLLFFSEEYLRPFGLLSVAYRYRVAGRIKS